jgi:hypothetical protein
MNFCQQHSADPYPELKLNVCCIPGGGRGKIPQYVVRPDLVVSNVTSDLMAEQNNLSLYY